tara:strand:- start:6588 stop:6860 length:273 start_codon:yes stop_codon:yes gene_type:complete
MAQLSNNSATAHNPKMGDGSRGVVQCVHDSSNNAYLYGSLNGTDYVLVESFTASALKEIVLCPYFKLSTSASSVTGTVGGTTKVYIDETR